jgi:hypothetical protein
MMIERSTRMRVAHRKSGVAYSELQKLNLYYNGQRRTLLGAEANLKLFAANNPTLKVQTWDAIRAIGSALDALRAEYDRDHAALTHHMPEVEHE